MAAQMRDPGVGFHHQHEVQHYPQRLAPNDGDELELVVATVALAAWHAGMSARTGVMRYFAVSERRAQRLIAAARKVGQHIPNERKVDAPPGSATRAAILAEEADRLGRPRVQHIAEQTGYSEAEARAALIAAMRMPATVARRAAKAAAA